MGRPSPADLLAYQLGNASQSMSSPPTPRLSDSRSSPNTSPEMQQTRFKARGAVARTVEEDSEEEDDEYIGYGKPKRLAPKESLMDLLGSDPPWAQADEVPAPPPVPVKKGFGNKFLRKRMGSTEPAPVAEAEADFRRPGAARRPGLGGLRSTKSSSSLAKEPKDDTFARTLSPQTRKLTAKGAQNVSESTRDLADFLRSSEPPISPNGTSNSSRGRSSTAASIETSTSTSNSSRIKNVIGKIGGGRSRDDETLEVVRSSSEAALYHSGRWQGGDPQGGDSFSSPTFESVSPLGMQHSLGHRTIIPESSVGRSTSINRAGSIQRSPSMSQDGSYSSRRSPRKPAPTPDESLLAQADRTSTMPYMSEATLAMILADNTPSQPAPRPPVAPRPRTTSLRKQAEAQAAAAAYESRKDIQKFERPALRDSVTQTEPASRVREPPASVKVARLSSTAPDSYVGSSRTRNLTSSSQGSSRADSHNVPRSLSPTAALRSGRPTSPAPDSPLPRPPGGGRARPISIAIQPAAPLDLTAVDGTQETWASHPHPLKRSASSDSFVDPPLTRGSYRESFASNVTLGPSSDPIFLALRVLQQTMRQGAALRIPSSAFPYSGASTPSTSPDHDAPLAAADPGALNQAQLHAILPTLMALQSQMASAATLLEIVLKRAVPTSPADAVANDKDEAAAAEFFLGEASSNHPAESETARAPGSSAASDSGIGEESLGSRKGGEETKSSGEDEYSDARTSSDDDAFPLLVKHLSIGRI